MKKIKHRNTELAIIQKNDCKRLRDRVVEAEKGRGRKKRPRKNDWKLCDYEIAA